MLWNPGSFVGSSSTIVFILKVVLKVVSKVVSKIVLKIVFNDDGSSSTMSSTTIGCLQRR